MGTKPAQLCHLERGKMIDTQENFVDTFNWIVDFINNLKGDGEEDNTKHIKVDTKTSDHPVIRYDPLSADVLSSQFTGFDVQCVDKDGQTTNFKAMNGIVFQTNTDSKNSYVVEDGNSLGLSGYAVIKQSTYYV